MTPRQQKFDTIQDAAELDRLRKNAIRRLSYHRTKAKRGDFLEHNAKMARSRYRDARAHVMQILGGACKTCGTHADLNIHHTKGNGDACRKAHGGGYSHLRHHIKEGCKGLELQCRQCHFEEHGGRWY